MLSVVDSYIHDYVRAILHDETSYFALDYGE